MEIKKGDRFGKWIVLTPNYDKAPHRGFRSLCECECKRVIKPVQNLHLLNDGSTQCKLCHFDSMRKSFDIELALSLRNQGKSFEEIASQVGCSRETIAKLFRGR